MNRVISARDLIAGGSGSVEGQKITIPGLTGTPRTVEMVQVRQFDPDDREQDSIVFTLWPDLNHPLIPKVPAEQSNFGHYYAQFMVEVSVVPNYPIEVEYLTLDDANQIAINQGL